MRILLEQVYGCQDQFDLQLCKPKLDLQNSREKEALENGWALYKGQWYNSRLTRVRVDASKLKPIAGYKSQVVETLNQERTAQIEEVYETFLRVRNFEPLYDLRADDDRALWLLISNDRVRAFTKFIKYDGALESNITCWDYSNPRDSIGKKIVCLEANIAAEMGYEHLYIGPGYNSSSLYKAKLPGFEWWDGSTWSTDIAKYQNLCQRDDSITTLQELSKLYAV
jgi:hypothetical protein